MNSARRLATLLLALLMGCATHGSDRLAEPLPESEDAMMLYAAGRALVTRFPQLFVMEMSDEDRRTVLAGASDALVQAPARMDLPGQQELQAFLHRRMRQTAEMEESAGAPFLEAAAAEEGAEVLPSGVIMRVIEDGDGRQPTEVDAVRVRFEGRLRDGTVFSATREEDPPKTYLMRSLLPCWAEALAKVSEGAKVHLVCPPQLAFGDQGQPPLVKPGSPLAFEIEVVNVIVRE